MNPFNPVTKIRYSLSKAGHVSLKAFDISGKVITLVSGRQDAGEKELHSKAPDCRAEYIFTDLQLMTDLL
ncbi:MAG: hypothetical protein R2942_16490 [Ignavibacteria bacterium]